MEGPKPIPEGTYDIGDGFYDPMKHIISKYDGEFKRNLSSTEEEQWILDKCRYVPNPLGDDSNVDGSEDKVIQEMIKLNQNPALMAARQGQQKQEK